ncbi:DUF456 domain-containing protein [Balneola sp. MJW-20]|uniref:DUF456 domain-containing protein n=1 Tax=Gracilimonas aurantiaca TaxID=3234185 RepID=UPI0034653939
MEIFLIIIGVILMLVGLLGSLLPVMPGLPFSYLGLLLLQYLYQPFSVTFLVIWALLVGTLMILDNVIPSWGTKKFGGSSAGVTGSVIGMIAGLFFPPLGFLIGPLLGAFIGELIVGNSSDKAMKSAWGSFIGFLTATGLKFIAAMTMTFYFVINLW